MPMREPDRPSQDASGPDHVRPDAGQGADADIQQPLSKRERAAVVARIQSLMEFWGITLEDLNDPAEGSVAPVNRGPLPIKYRHPVSGETWDGQGVHPDWLRRALLQEGLRVEELRPDSKA